ncbi:translation elongation factor P [gamma proteobacterium HTCC5015]|nr:translation elongation factor P [gamma proteobacterium HTCC5015]
MASFSTNEFKNGLKIMIDGDPYNIVENELVKPGKGQAFNRVKVRNLKTGKVVDKTYKSGEKVEAADVMDTEMDYLYTDGEFWNFMDPNTFEQVGASESAVADSKQWLKEQDSCIVTLWNGEPISVLPPNHVVLEVTQTDPGIRGDTAQGATKPATVETGATVQVPLFVDNGDLLKIDTRTGKYISRAKED